MEVSFAFVIPIVLYLVRRVLKFDECMACLPDGFKAMVPAILILVFAWTLKSMTDSLGAANMCRHCSRKCGRYGKSSSGNHLPLGCFLAFANRYKLGNIRNPDPDRGTCI